MATLAHKWSTSTPILYHFIIFYPIFMGTCSRWRPWSALRCRTQWWAFPRYENGEILGLKWCVELHFLAIFMEKRLDIQLLFCINIYIHYIYTLYIYSFINLFVYLFICIFIFMTILSGNTMKTIKHMAPPAGRPASALDPRSMPSQKASSMLKAW
jgi:cation transport ATPase